jgi:hypothetical protein
LQPLPSTGPERAIVSACSFSAARFSRKQQERQRRASGAEDSGHDERALESVGERGGKRSAAVEPDPVVGNPADQPDMREAEPWHHALLGEQNGGYSAELIIGHSSRRVTGRRTVGGDRWPLASYACGEGLQHARQGDS